MDQSVIEECKSYIGRTRACEDAMSPVPARRLAALLGRDVAPDNGDALPATWHWAYFNPGIAQADIGPDGHERLGLFLPPAPFHRRMWAAGDITVHRPLRLGMPAQRVSTIDSVEFKTGRSGDLCFVKVRHEVTQDGVTCLSEIQTVVYRDRGLPERALRAPGDPVPRGYFVHSDMQLFFYSAVTHNGHRIHWDREFCRDVEGYPDLVVHGPLMATHLCDGMLEEMRACRFSFRATAPVFVTTPIQLAMGKPGERRDGRIERADGHVSMEATLELP
ncbi:FAS1-like dehydratase domain-containing protein [Mesorhizobium xinjiangense]|uniref:FAS1-like dehydratase domain-containing protein n=1 Tax=Mesorhizobium xinjiangense TaxID=2678685 RepID=UPI0012EEBF47|nr:MaoC family dehydratase N-terminal domain-containing protein [Mesorhizobium xinjiangense]